MVVDECYPVKVTTTAAYRQQAVHIREHLEKGVLCSCHQFGVRRACHLPIHTVFAELIRYQSFHMVW